jgi:hypothetical protein
MELGALALLGILSTIQWCRPGYAYVASSWSYSRLGRLGVRRNLVCGSDEHLDTPAKTDLVLAVMVECWAANTTSVNANKDPALDQILQGLVSPAPQSLFVLQRAFWNNESRHDGDHHRRRARRVAMCHHLIKREYRLWIRQDFSVNEMETPSPGIDWTVRLVDNSTALEGWLIGPNALQSWTPQPLQPTVQPNDNQLLARTHQIALDILDLVWDACDRQIPIPTASLNQLLVALEERLDGTLGTDLRGRTAADTMLTLALAGVATPRSIYTKLETVLRLELQRLQGRPSRTRRSSNELIHLVEKLAAAGAIPTTHPSNSVAVIHELIATALQGGGNLDMDTAQFLLTRNVYVPVSTTAWASSVATATATATAAATQPYDLLQARPLLWIWRFASRLSKPMSMRNESDVVSDDVRPFQDRIAHPPQRTPWIPNFVDPTKPLVMDLGCGFGITLLGLALWPFGVQADRRGTTAGVLLPETVTWSDCNFLGSDWHGLGVRFATGIAQRWSSSDHATDRYKDVAPNPWCSAGRLQYECRSTHDLLDQLLCSESLPYPGRIVLVLLQFPTPYRLLADRGNDANDENGFKAMGNMQLPAHESNGFMGSSLVLGKIAELLRRQGGGRLLVQSNCEDVAVQIQSSAMECGFTAIPMESHVSEMDNALLTERTRRWLQSALARDGDQANHRRAIGPEWSATRLLPERCASETDVACQIQNVPVHRILFQI